MILFSLVFITGSFTYQWVWWSGGLVRVRTAGEEVVALGDGATVGEVVGDEPGPPGGGPEVLELVPKALLDHSLPRCGDAGGGPQLLQRRGLKRL